MSKYKAHGPSACVYIQSHTTRRALILTKKTIATIKEIQDDLLEVQRNIICSKDAKGQDHTFTSAMPMQRFLGVIFLTLQNADV